MSRLHLRAAGFSFFAGSDIRTNRHHIALALQEAQAQGARFLLTPECALCGYPGAGRSDCRDLDRQLLVDSEAELEEQARSLGLTLLLGSIGIHEDHYSNDLLCLGSSPDSGQRYRKRCLTPLDRGFFQPGEQPCSVRVDDWSLGLSICFDVRFPSCWADMADADAFVCAAHMAGPDPDPGCKAQVIPALFTARASEWAKPLLLCNSSAPDRWLDSAYWDARGLCRQGCAQGLLVCDLESRDAFDPWYSQLATYQRQDCR